MIFFTLVSKVGSFVFFLESFGNVFSLSLLITLVMALLTASSSSICFGLVLGVGSSDLGFLIDSFSLMISDFLDVSNFGGNGVSTGLGSVFDFDLALRD